MRVYFCLLYAGLTYLWLYACSTRITLQFTGNTPGGITETIFFYVIFNSQNNIGSMRRYPELFVIFKIILLLQYKNVMAPVLEQNGPTLGTSLSM